MCLFLLASSCPPQMGAILNSAEKKLFYRALILVQDLNKNTCMVTNDLVSQSMLHVLSFTQCLPVMYDVPSEGSGIGPVGEVRLIPKWDTLELIPFSKGHARVFVDLYKRATNSPSQLCPRDFLRRAVANAAKEGIYINAAFENEFLLLYPDKSDKGYKLVDDTVYCATFSMDLHHEVVSDICDALAKQGILVETYMPESAPGQQEISSEPMKAACQQPMKAVCALTDCGWSPRYIVIISSSLTIFLVSHKSHD